MRRIARVSVIVVVLVACASPRLARAALSDIGQEPQVDSGKNVVGTTVGIDGAVVAWSLGYARGVPLPIDRQLVLHTRLTLPMTRPDFGDWKWAGGVRMNAVQWRGFAWPLSLAVVARGMSNASVRAMGMGTELLTMPGYYPRRWFVAGEVSWDQEWGTHVRHSDAYREWVYAGVHDGWYRNTGFTMRYGARVGGRPWKHLELWARAGYEQHGRFDIVLPPLYALLGLDFRF